jgi:hypothetical protein
MLKNGVYEDRMMRAAQPAPVQGCPTCKKCNGTGRLGFYDKDHTQPVPCARCQKLAPKDTPSEAQSNPPQRTAD